MIDLPLEETPEGVILKIKVTPKARTNEIVGVEEGEVKIKISAPPEKGKANEALLDFLAKTFHLPKRSIFLLSGETSRHKKVLFAGMKIDNFINKIK